MHLCEVGDSEEYVLHSKADVAGEVCAMACHALGVWRSEPAGHGGLAVEPVSNNTAHCLGCFIAKRERETKLVDVVRGWRSRVAQ